MNIEQRRRLHAARELIEITIAETCLDALDTALRLEHPMLDKPRLCGDPPTLHRARAASRLVAALRGALDAYRLAVDRALDPWPEDGLEDDLPF